MFVIPNAGVRRALRVMLPWVVIPLAAVTETVLFREKQIAAVIFTVTILTLLLFAAGFEKKKTGNRRLVLMCVCTALAVAGRFLPVLKPVTAMAVLCGMYFGAESGFFVGSMAAMLSNFYFGQGPWTAFQMLAWGLCGYVAGCLAKPLQKSRALLLLYGFFAGILYSFLLDIWTVLWYNGGFSVQAYLAALVTALPYTLSYAIGNILFLALLARPMGEKMERIHTKYGI